jgi:plastocyanin
MKSALPVLLLLAPTLITASSPAATAPAKTASAAMHAHCAPAIVTPVAGDPGAYRIETAHGTTIARRQAPIEQPLATTAVAEFRVFPFSFDADGDTIGTVHDTILVALGTTVRWVRRGPGFHTVTSGADSGDPTATLEYNLIFDELTNSVEFQFNTTGKHDFFCFIHEPVMEGTVLVTSATLGAGGPAVITRAAFTRPPAPNPTRGALAFAVAIPHASQVAQRARHSGRLVARLQDGAGRRQYPFAWNGRGARPHAAERALLIRLAGNVRETRRYR